MSARAYHRVLKVARTIADVAGMERVATAHIAEAIRYRRGDRAAYLGGLARCCQRFHLEVPAYCPMSNYVHLVIIPESELAPEQVFRPRHAQAPKAIISTTY